MFRRSREIAIFSMSALDVIFGALGAFMILMVALFPLQGQLEKQKSYHRQILVTATWEQQGLDVDLWLKNPAGEFLGPKPDAMPGESVFAIRDAVGPGRETASEVGSSSGTYEVMYQLHSLNGGTPPAVVQGSLIVRSPIDDQPGQFVVLSLGQANLTTVGQMRTWARIEVNFDDPNASLVPNIDYP